MMTLPGWTMLDMLGVLSHAVREVFGPHAKPMILGALGSNLTTPSAGSTVIEWRS